jgi:signal peptidase I
MMLQKKRLESTRSLAKVIFIALLLRSFVVEAYQIPSGSMIPTLQIGDHIFVNKFVYGLRLPFSFWKASDGRAPRRGEVVVFDHPTEHRPDPLIKRVVGVPGDVLEVKDGVLFVNGAATVLGRVDEGDCRYDDHLEGADRWLDRDCRAFRERLGEATFTTLRDPEPPNDEPARWFGPVVVPPRSVFVMGDNRDNSADSRYFGMVPYDHLRGRAMVVWWSRSEPRGVKLDRMGQTIR